VMTWPVDTRAAVAEARRVGVDAIISKDLGLLADVLAGGPSTVGKRRDTSPSVEGPSALIDRFRPADEDKDGSEPSGRSGSP
jgi:hypothetical protein